ncbi:MAG: AAA family ATPase [bacterium]|nr:AAA family ATPase [bacterium]
MKKSILLTGISGSGKSEVSRQLKAMGYETYDVDTIYELCVMIDKKTGLPTPYDNGNDLEKIQKMYWLYKPEVLKSIIANQKNEIAFYSGWPNNLEEIVPLFTKVIVLTAVEDTIRQRLNTRTDNGFGKSVEVQDYILRGREKMENELRERGAVIINSEKSLDQVVKEVIIVAVAQ